MDSLLTVSNEFLAIGNKSFLPLEVLGVFEQIKTKVEVGSDYREEVEKLNAVIKRNTGLLVTVRSLPDQQPVACVFLHWFLIKDSAVNSGQASEFLRSVLHLMSEGKENHTGVVNLDTVKVSGGFSKIPFDVFISDGLVARLTPEECTAVLLHELGHAFSSLATLGEYLWVNYLLTDGIDIILKKKVNRYKIEFLEAQVPDDKKARTQILADLLSKNRDAHNPFVSFGTIKRSEQVADQFASRLGVGRALVTGLDKLGKDSFFAYNDYSDVLWPRILLNILDTTDIFLKTIFVFPWLLRALGLGGYVVSDYDRTKERFTRIKRDLVIQLRHLPAGSPLHERILADIEVIEQTTSKMITWERLTHRVINKINPLLRRATDRFKLEKTLEDLMANDLFIVSNKFNNLLQSKK